MVTLSARFDGRAIVLDEPSRLPLPSGTRVKVSVETVEDSRPTQSAPQAFKPLSVQIDAETSHAIASDPEFNIEES